MPLPGTPGTAKIALQFTNLDGDSQCENVFYLRDTSGVIFIDPVATCNVIFVDAVGTLIPQLSPFVILNGVSFEDVRTVPFGGVVVPEAPTPGTDSAGGVQLPASASLSIKKTTALLGRGGYGRWYWPIGSAGFLVNGNTVLAAAAINWAAALQSFQDALETSFVVTEMGIVSYYSATVLRPAGRFAQITHWGAVDLNVDTQRRRLNE